MKMLELEKMQKNDDGLTDLGRELLMGKDEFKEIEEKMVELENDSKVLELEIKEQQMKMKDTEFLFSGEVRLRLI